MKKLIAIIIIAAAIILGASPVASSAEYNKDADDLPVAYLSSEVTTNIIL